MGIMFESGRKRRVIFLLMLFVGVIVVLFTVDVPVSHLLAAPRIVGDHKRPGSLFLQDTAAHATLEGTRNIGYHGNRSGCPEKIRDLVSTGAVVQAVGALDDSLDRLHNFSTLESIEFLPNFRSPCWLQRSKTTSSRGQTRHSSSSSGGQVTLRCLPAVLLAGMPKCGTTTLFNNLAQHPDFVAQRKEPHFWTRKVHDAREDYPYSYYSNLIGTSSALSGCNLTSDGTPYHGRLTADCSASSFWDSRRLLGLHDNQGQLTFLIPHLFHRLVPYAQIIVIFRDPVERLYSDYLYFHVGTEKSQADFHNRVEETISDLLECSRLKSARYCAYAAKDIQSRIHVGLYSIYVEDWLDVYRREQFYFVQLEEFSESPEEHTNKIFEFLDIDVVDVTSKQSNSRRPKQRRTGDMWDKTRRILRQFYAPYNRRLAQILNDDKYLWGYS